VSATREPGRVSVVMPSYNHAVYLVKRMEGLLRQSYQNIDILVIDDCSTQNNVEILRRYERYPNIRLVLHQKNTGLVPVMNQGIEQSSGEFILFAQCDDDCDPAMIERLVKSLQAHPTAGIAFCRSLMIDENDRVLGDDFTFREPAFRARCASDSLLSGQEMARFLFHSCVIPNLSALLIRRECFDTVGMFSLEYAVCVDWEFFFRVSTRYDTCYIAEPLNKFRQHAATVRSTAKGLVTYGEFFQVLLANIRSGSWHLSFAERCRFRTRVMYLWCHHLMTQPVAAIRNAPEHLASIFRLDPPALLFAAPGIVGLMAAAVKKLVDRVLPTKVA
jgi:glycosyltransferase involved in cell wall biosynthesis